VAKIVKHLYYTRCLAESSDSSDSSDFTVSSRSLMSSALLSQSGFTSWFSPLEEIARGDGRDARRTPLAEGEEDYFNMTLGTSFG